MRMLVIFLFVLLFSVSAGATASGPYQSNSLVTTSSTASVAYGPVASVSGTNYTSGEQMQTCIPHSSTATGTTFAGPYPVYLRVHGGGWDSGGAVLNNDTYECNALAGYGFAAFALDYRLNNPSTTGSGDTGCTSGCAAWPAQIVDVQLAIRYICTNASTYNADCSHIICDGDSTGAALCEQAAFYQQGIWPMAGDAAPGLYTSAKTAPTGVIAEFGPAFGATEANGPPNNTESPYSRDLARSNPRGVTDGLMLVQGITDTSVPRASSDAMRAALRANRLPVREVIYKPGSGYTGSMHEYSCGTGLACIPSQNQIRTFEIQWMIDRLIGFYPWMTRPADAAS